MATTKRKKNPPKYCHHKQTGQARVTLHGKQYYLGKYGTPESKEAYRQLIAQYEGGFIARSDRHAVKEDGYSVGDLVIRYGDHLKDEHGVGPHKPYNQRRPILDCLMANYAALPLEMFGPKKLKDLQQTLRRKDQAREYINRQIKWVVAAFEWAVSEEMCSDSVWNKLKTVKPLRASEKLKEGRQVSEVPVEVVERTLPILSPILADMVRLQANTGMRPSELCMIRPADIDRTNPRGWIYTPVKHKTQGKGKLRRIALNEHAQAILAPYLLRAETDYCFSPRENMKRHLEQVRAGRKTPMNQGYQRKAKPKVNGGNHYTRHSYRRAIERAITNHNKKPENEHDQIPHWFPYQLRHLTLTLVERAFAQGGSEKAQHVAGHTTPNMTETYIHRNDDHAFDGVERLPKIG